MNPELEKGISAAIGREQATYKQYVRLSKLADNHNLSLFFNELAMQEAKHEMLLEEFKKTKDFRLAKEKMSEQYVRENFTVVEDLNPNATHEGLYEGFERAIRQEQSDEQFYTELENKTTDRDTKDLFTYLVEEEMEHERLVRKEFLKFKSSKS